MIPIWLIWIVLILIGGIIIYHVLKAVLKVALFVAAMVIAYLLVKWFIF